MNLTAKPTKLFLKNTKKKKRKEKNQSLVLSFYRPTRQHAMSGLRVPLCASACDSLIIQKKPKKLQKKKEDMKRRRRCSQCRMCAWARTKATKCYSLILQFINSRLTWKWPQKPHKQNEERRGKGKDGRRPMCVQREPGGWFEFCVLVPCVATALSPY